MNPSNDLGTGGDLSIQYFRDHGPFFYLMVDEHGAVRYVNRFTASILKSPVLGLPYRDVFVDLKTSLDLAALARDPAQEHLLNVAGANGLPQTIQCHCHAVGNRLLVIGHVDVPEWQRLQVEMLHLNSELNAVTRDLQKANAKLAALHALKDTFVGFAAHDLRKPLGVIQAYTERLIDDADDRLAPEDVQSLQLVLDRATAMGQLIDDLLDVTVMASGRREPALAAVDLDRVLQTAVVSVQHLAAARQVQIVVSRDPSLPAVALDRLKIEQAIINLLGNAVEHTAPGTAVRMWVGRRGERLEVSISDDGPGIAAERMPGLFSPAGRGGALPAGGPPGRGLGLAIAKHMVEAHRGTIWAESQPGRGATFTFSLPLTAAGHEEA